MKSEMELLLDEILKKVNSKGSDDYCASEKEIISVLEAVLYCPEIDEIKNGGGCLSFWLYHHTSNKNVLINNKETAIEYIRHLEPSDFSNISISNRKIGVKLFYEYGIELLCRYEDKKLFTFLGTHKELDNDGLVKIDPNYETLQIGSISPGIFTKKVFVIPKRVFETFV